MSRIFVNVYSGKRFDFIERRAADVCLDDIAYSLSNLCRFNGHTGPFYSVCHHSLAMSDMFNNPRMKTLALLHDGHEAYFSDISRPVVDWLDILSQGTAREAIMKAKRLIDATIFEHFKVALPTIAEARELRLADDVLFEAERDAFGFGDSPVITWEVLQKYLAMHRHEACQKFVERFILLQEANDA